MFFSEIYQPGVADFDRSGKLGYEAILRIFENTASRHSDSSGDDIIEESRNGITWVLTDWRVQIVRRPDSKAPLRVTTWVRDSVPTGRIFRDYTLADETGTELVCAESRLILFDLRAQKIIRIDQQRFRSYLPETRGVFASAAPRLRAPAAFDGEKTLPLRRSDIDFNGHVHNTKYLDFALEALPDTVPRDAFTGFRMVYPKAVKDVEAVTLRISPVGRKPLRVRLQRRHALHAHPLRDMKIPPLQKCSAGVSSAFCEPADIRARLLAASRCRARPQ